MLALLTLPLFQAMTLTGRDTFTHAGYTYRVTGWDDEARALRVERDETTT